jgi:hypothetical protein
VLSAFSPAPGERHNESVLTMATRRQRLEALEATLGPRDHELASERPLVLDPKLGPQWLETIRHLSDCCDDPIAWAAEKEEILAEARAKWAQRCAERAAKS